MNEITTTTQRVRDILKNDAKCRNSDLWLIIQTMKSLGLKMEIDYEQIKQIPSFETITRCRRFIQNNEKLYLPTIKEVSIKRGIKQEMFKEHYLR